MWKNEAAYCAWLRGQCRRIWARHPIRIKTIQAARIPLTDALREAHGLGPKVRTACRCAICNGLFKQSDVEVDHKSHAGSFSTIEEWRVWIDNLLLVGCSDLQVLCKECHSIVSYSQRMRCSFEDARALKKVIAFSKVSRATQLQRLRTMTNALEQPSFKSAKLRVELYAKLLGYEELWASHLARDRSKEWEKD